MKHFKQIIIYLSILSIITISLFSSNPLKVYAEIPSSQIVESHTGAWGEYPFNYHLTGKYYTIQDSTGIPTSTVLLPQYFYTDDNVTFYALDGKDLYTAILNRGIGVTVRQDFVATLYNNFMQRIQLYDNTVGLYLQGALYDSNNLFLGYCVNDITGCYYQQPQPADTPAVDVPDELTDDVYYHYKYYIDNDTSIPDFITVQPPSQNYISNQTLVSPNYYITDADFTTWFNENIDTLQAHDNVYTFAMGINGSGVTNFNVYKPSELLALDNYHYIYQGNDYNKWNNFCLTYNLTKDDNTLLFSDMVSNPTNSSNYSITYKAYDNSDTNITSFTRYRYDIDTNNRVIRGYYTENYTKQLFILGNQGDLNNSFRNATLINFGKPYTIYKNADAYNNVKNKTYSPTSIPSSIFLNYNPSNDNSFTITYNNIDNSTNNNSIIYNDSHDTYYDNTDNGNTNVNDISNDVQVIINIIYPGGNPGPDPGPNPNPDDDDNPLDDDTILDAILAALKRFFDVIGKILGTVLAGLLEVIDALLESIAGIMDNLTGLTEFLASLFSWIPAPVPQVIAIGFSLCILAAIIKFIRG